VRANNKSIMSSNFQHPKKVDTYLTEPEKIRGTPITKYSYPNNKGCTIKREERENRACYHK
jgi:hypothetical protein